MLHHARWVLGKEPSEKKPHRSLRGGPLGQRAEVWCSHKKTTLAFQRSPRAESALCYLGRGHPVSVHLSLPSLSLAHAPERPGRTGIILLRTIPREGLQQSSPGHSPSAALGAGAAHCGNPNTRNAIVPVLTPRRMQVKTVFVCCFVGSYKGVLYLHKEDMC